MSLLVWLAFGAIAVVPVFENLTWQICLYAVLSLTVVRMVPVAVALVGSRLGRTTVAFIGWFGPRGLASIVFALIATEELGEREAAPVVSVIAITVLLSVIVHGATATPLARRSRHALNRESTAATPSATSEIPTRRLIRGKSSTAQPASPR